MKILIIFFISSIVFCDISTSYSSEDILQITVSNYHYYNNSINFTKINGIRIDINSDEPINCTFVFDNTTTTYNNTISCVFETSTKPNCTELNINISSDSTIFEMVVN